MTSHKSQRLGPDQGAWAWASGYLGFPEKIASIFGRFLRFILSKMRGPLLCLLLTLLAVACAEPSEQWNGPVGALKCTDKWKRWTDGFAAGERAITMYSQSYVCDGNDCDVVGAFSPKYSFACATKGPAGKGSTLALDPVAQYTMIGVTSEFHSQKPCKFLEEQVGPPPGRLKPVDHRNSTLRNSSSENRRQSVCTEPASNVCEYPDPPQGLTKLPHTGMRLDKWPGLLMDMGNLNNANPHLNHESWAAGEKFKHMLPYGIDGGTVCDDSDYENGKVMHERAFYDGGILIEKTRGPATTRSYIFKRDDDRELAKKDSRNAGLQYAKTFTGENGCDTEVVWEIEPKAGGGIDLELTVPIDANSCETEAGLRNAIHVWYTGEEVVVVVKRRALKEASYLSTCDSDGYKELLRFASTFVCKATGEAVAASVKFYDDVDREYALSNLSTDAANPTPYFTGKGVNYLGTNPPGRCVEGGLSYRPHGSRFSISATAENAPESCGSFYWDPLLEAVPGDGFAWELASGQLNGGKATAKSRQVSLVAALALAVVTICLCWQYR